MNRPQVGALLLAVLLSALAAVPTTAATPRKMALGVTRVDDRSLTAYQAYIAEAGLPPAIWGIAALWGGANKAFPDKAFLDQLDPSTVPMIWWQPVDPDNPDLATFTYRKMINGKHDAYIRRFADDAKAYGKRVLIRFAQEQDGRWFPWSVYRFDNTPKRFRLAWQHIVKIFRARGATNVKFLWSPNKVQPVSYPGDRYVDYVGFSVFNWSSADRPWKSLPQLVNKGMKRMAAFTHKPVILAETGSSSIGGNKAAWIRNGYPALHKKWRQIKAIVYFDLDAATLFGQVDWRLTSPMGAMEAYKDLLAQPIFQGRIK